MRKPLISIIVPVYNVEKYLSKCLDSLVNQTYENIEIVCVDDGSTDSSGAICDEYAKKDARIKVIHKENGGLSDARNAGLEAINGEYVMFIDSDDWIDIDTCEQCINTLERYDVDLILWSYIREYDNNTKPKRLFEHGSKYFSNKEAKEKIFLRCVGLSGEELRNVENMDSIVTAWGKLYKSEIINNIRFKDTTEIGTEDALFNVYVMCNIDSAFYIDRYMNHYRRDNAISLTSTYKPELYKRWQCMYDYIETFINEKKLDDDFKCALNNRIALGICGLGLNIMSSDMSVAAKISEIKDIIRTERYRKAYNQLDFRYFPIHWKIFYGCAKLRFAPGVYILLMCINMLRK